MGDELNINMGRLGRLITSQLEERHVLTMAEATNHEMAGIISHTVPLPRNPVLGIVQLVLWWRGTSEGTKSDSRAHFQNSLRDKTAWAKECGTECVDCICLHAPASEKIQCYQCSC